MARLDIPFNISILHLTDDKLKGIRPVRSMDILDGNTTNFNQDGLFSTEIFGKFGTQLRNKRFSYIDVKIPIFHPVIYKSLISLKRLYEGIINGTEYANWDKETNDFVRSDPINGRTGFAFFIEYWDKIEFKETGSVERSQNILLIKKYKDIALTNRVIVMPAGLRDVEIDKAGRMTKDEINNFYLKLLSISNTISVVIIKSNPEIVDLARSNLNRTFLALYDTIESMIKGKKKLLLNKWASRRIYNGTRNVITPMSTSVRVLGEYGNPTINNSLISLYQATKAVLPVSIFNLKNSFLTKVFTDQRTPARLVDKQTLKTVDVRLSNNYFDLWMTDEGLEKVITKFSDPEIRNKPIEINGYYLGLTYTGPDNTFKLIQDIDDIPPERSKEDVHPMTFCELLYLSVYKVINNYPGFLTRYPILTVGSIYPSFPYVKTTIKTERRTELDDSWELTENIAIEFPVRTSPYFNTLSPHPSKLGRLDGDFD